VICLRDLPGEGKPLSQELERSLRSLGGAHWVRPWAAVRLGDLRKVFGPAWLVMMADVDAASIITAMQTGASFKYAFIAILLLLIIPLYFICEVAGRVGSVTGKGLGQLIRENFSRRVSVALSLPMAVTDFLSYVAEYAGIAVGATIVGIPPVIVLPVAYVLHIVLVYRRRYASAEKTLLVVSAVMVLAYLVFMKRGVSAEYPLMPARLDRNFLFLIAANVGAVIMPFMLFYQTTATAQKDFHSVRATKVETFVGAMFSEVLMVAVVVVSSSLAPTLSLASDHDVARAIMSIGGAYAPLIFSIGLIAAGFLALVVISMASAWGITEALDLRYDTWFKIYVVESLPAAVVPLLFANLIALILNLMVALVFVLIGPVIALGLLAQNDRLMGEHSLNRFDKIAFWSSVAIVIACGLIAFV
jgi:NRAMP (natural resistance-associated macrophage protein)-like metal ion transporter